MRIVSVTTSASTVRVLGARFAFEFHTFTVPVSGSAATEITDRATWDHADEPRISFPVSAVSFFPKCARPMNVQPVSWAVRCIGSRNCRIAVSLLPSSFDDITDFAASRTSNPMLFSRMVSARIGKSCGRSSTPS